MTLNAMRKIRERVQDMGTAPAVKASGLVTRFDGQVIECDGFPVTVGSICHVHIIDQPPVEAEIIGFRDGRNLAFVYDQSAEIEVGALVTVLSNGRDVEVGDALLGRVIDAQGNPLDNGKPLRLKETWPLHGKLTNPLNRKPISQPLDVGVRSVNALLSIGRGQRVGIVAGSGVGKSVLLSMFRVLRKLENIL